MDVHSRTCTSRRIRFIAVANSTARVLAVGVVVFTRLLAFAVHLLFHLAPYAWTTVASLVFARVATGLQATYVDTAVVGGFNFDVACQGSFVTTTWNDAFDRNQA